jgi:hypothetical protein
MIDRLAKSVIELTDEVISLRDDILSRDEEIANLKAQLSRHELRTGPIEDMVYGPK